jgi:hypothetical protein
MVRSLLFQVIFLLQITFGVCQDSPGYEVTQIHMAQGRTPESMIISWITKTDSASIVMFGTSPDQLENKVSGETTQYDFNYPRFMEFYKSGIIHHATLENLKPSTTYYYQCGDFSLGFTSGLQSFKTMPEPGDLSPFTFAVLGDLGQTTDSQITVQQMASNPDYGMILHTGDLSYANCDQKQWDSYGLLIEDLSKQKAWMVGPGNHEIEVANTYTPFLAFEKRYKMPAIKPAEFGPITLIPEPDGSGLLDCTPSVYQSVYDYGNSFYSFEVGSTHIIFINPYTVTNETSAQYQWLVSDLESVNRTRTPWIITVMHNPWYNSDMKHHEETMTVSMKQSMESVLYKYKVNVALSGHVHAYERTYPVYQDVVKDDGIVHIVIGDGGNKEGHAADYYDPQPAWSAFRNGTQYGHAELLVAGKEKMVWRWHRNIDDVKVTQDEVTICNIALGMKAYC